MIYSEADFATMVNLAGFFHVSQPAAAAMLRQHRGHIVTITTSLVDRPMAAVPAALAAITKGAGRGHTVAGNRNHLGEQVIFSRY
jgi:NAD(P)-dependent dehydrogenase (short-subunit alcohol dehydrogenase family)